MRTRRRMYNTRDFATFKRKAIRAAKELQYDEEIVKQIENATDDITISNILRTAASKKEY